MSWPALSRYGIEPAPGGLAFVQELMNTIAAGKPRREDLLADPSTAENWLRDALANLAGRPEAAVSGVELDPEGLERLRDFRDDLRHTLTTPDSDSAVPDGPASTALPTVSVSMHWDAAGRVQPVPRGSGWRMVASLAAIEVFKAQLDGSWSRIKTCRNPRCAVAFFDHSRNNSGVWHDVKVCGNAANLRAYRARLRATRTTT
ncbi:CGNR zinc finger domain-containing protein [Streptomyces sp. NPDC059861]|uniref:CGNR zinc finger domain-containing protein n=1 Tax=Streptomyces sp. NPDC059861 TaxID=3346974 RepID=UPI003652EAE5